MNVLFWRPCQVITTGTSAPLRRRSRIPSMPSFNCAREAKARPFPSTWMSRKVTRTRAVELRFQLTFALGGCEPFIIEGYSAVRRIAQALTAARRDERRLGFATPFRMRPIKCAPGAPAVIAKWPRLRPLYHWIEVGSVKTQKHVLLHHFGSASPRLPFRCWRRA